MTGVLVLVAVFLTSLLSAIVGMAGGLVLIVLLISIMPVPAAMILHGIVQSTANGSRYWYLRQNTAWRVLPGYSLGLLLATGVFVMTSFVAEPALILIAAGALPWVSQFTPERFRLDITRPIDSVLCGFVTTAAQLIAGASGPILDAFYQRADLNRFEIVATKALTQFIGHLVKIAFFLYVSVAVIPTSHLLLSWWFIVAYIVASLIATKVGTLVLEKVSESSFRTWTNRLILTLGAVTIVIGLFQMIE